MATQTITVEFVDGSSREVRCGAFSQIAAKRRFGLDAVKVGDPEAALYALWVELNGAPAANGRTDELYDEWLKSVTNFELTEPDEPADDVEDPTPAVSSGSSLDSPPTSESVPAP